MDFRSLSPADQPFLWEMLYHALFVPPGQPPFPREILQEPRIAHYVSGWGRPGDLGLCAQDGEAQVGAGWLRLFPAADPGYGYVDGDTPELSIALLPAYRGRGIGGELVTRLLRLAQPRYPTVSLSVSAANPARHLYERLGFQVLSSSGDSLTMLWVNTSYV